MLLTGYTLEIFRSKCHAGAQTLHCFAHLKDDVAEALPCLNNVVGFTYSPDPPTLTLKNSGKLITIHPRKIRATRRRRREPSPGCRGRSTVPGTTGRPWPIICPGFASISLAAQKIFAMAIFSVPTCMTTTIQPGRIPECPIRQKKS